MSHCEKSKINDDDTSVIRVCFACKLCRSFLPTVDKFIEHKKKHHFIEYQKIQYVLFEEGTIDSYPDINTYHSDGFPVPVSQSSRRVTLRNPWETVVHEDSIHHDPKTEISISNYKGKKVKNKIRCQPEAKLKSGLAYSTLNAVKSSDNGANEVVNPVILNCNPFVRITRLSKTEMSRWKVPECKSNCGEIEHQVKILPATKVDSAQTEFAIPNVQMSISHQNSLKAGTNDHDQNQLETKSRRSEFLKKESATIQVPLSTGLQFQMSNLQDESSRLVSAQKTENIVSDSNTGLISHSERKRVQKSESNSNPRVNFAVNEIKNVQNLLECSSENNLNLVQQDQDHDCYSFSLQTQNFQLNSSGPSECDIDLSITACENQEISNEEQVYENVDSEVVIKTGFEVQQDFPVNKTIIKKEHNIKNECENHESQRQDYFDEEYSDTNNNNFNSGSGSDSDFCPEPSKRQRILKTVRKSVSKSKSKLKPKEPAPVICEICGLSYSCQAYLHQHKKTHSDLRPYKCLEPGCSASFKLHSGLYHHASTHAKSRPFACSLQECTFSFKDKLALKKHMNGHSLNRQLFKCIENGCDKIFTCSSSLKMHVQLKHSKSNEDIPKFTCDICQKSYGRKSVLKKHKLVHSEDRPWKCKEEGCGAAFKHKQVLVEHERGHSGEEPYQCDECGKAFARGISFRRHMLSHRLRKDPPKYPCHLCRRKFVESRQFERHLLVHEKNDANPKPFVCLKCGKGCKTNMHLRTHEKTHEDNDNGNKRKRKKTKQAFIEDI